MHELANAVALPMADAWGMHGDVGTGWWIVMIAGMAVFWGAVILAGVWLLRGALQGRHSGATETPIDVLRRRFAEGSISAEDYEQRRKLLTEPAAAGPDEPAEDQAGASSTVAAGRSA